MCFYVCFFPLKPLKPKENFMTTMCHACEKKNGGVKVSFLRIYLAFDSHTPVHYLERFRTSAVKLFISCYLYYVLTGRPPRVVTTKAVMPHLSKTSKRPQGLPLGVTTERCGFRQGSMFCVLKVPPSLQTA